ncbi:MAG: hypothetical protein ACI9MR_000443 [Myxococcota bacterium]|jgi:hypothetical protein
MLAVLSFLVPGLGQLLCGRFLNAMLFGWAAFWLHMLCLATVRGSVPTADAMAAWLGGAPAAGALHIPVAVITTAVTLTLHVAAAYAVRPRPSAGTVGGKEEAALELI